MAQLKLNSELLAICLVCLAIISRWLPHPPNIAPVAAVAIFSGMLIKQKWAMGVPIFALLLSDLFLGFYGPVMLAVYSAFSLSFWIGRLIGQAPSLIRIAFGTLGSAILFFLITNAAVWWFGSMYNHSLGGLGQAYLAGLPFFRNSLIGDVMYLSLLLSLWRLAGQNLPQISSPKTSATILVRSTT